MGSGFRESGIELQEVYVLRHLYARCSAYVVSDVAST